jgi:hypothetical protein
LLLQLPALLVGHTPNPSTLYTHIKCKMQNSEFKMHNAECKMYNNTMQNAKF